MIKRAKLKKGVVNISADKEGVPIYKLNLELEIDNPEDATKLIKKYQGSFGDLDFSPVQPQFGDK